MKEEEEEKEERGETGTTQQQVMTKSVRNEESNKLCLTGLKINLILPSSEAYAPYIKASVITDCFFIGTKRTQRETHFTNTTEMRSTSQVNV